MFTIVAALHFMWRRTHSQSLRLIITDSMSEVVRCKESFSHHFLLVTMLLLSIIQVLSLTVPVGAAASIPFKTSVRQCRAAHCTHSNLSTVIMLPLMTVIQLGSIPVRHSKTFTRRKSGPTSRLCIRPSLTCILGHLLDRIRCQLVIFQGSPSDLRALATVRVSQRSQRRVRDMR